MYLQNNRAHVSEGMTVTQVTIRCLIWKCSTPDLFDDLTKKKINYYTTNRPNRKDMSQDLQPQSNQLECGTILFKTRMIRQQRSAD